MYKNSQRMEGVEFVIYVDRCVKFDLPDGSTVDILTDVLQGMMEWIQEEDNQPEACGFVLGYQNYYTHNITLSDITIPQANDKRTRFFCKLIDSIHFDLLKRNKQKKNFYMGVWHTHPQNIPVPSVVDLNDWKEILKKDKTASNYAFFIILGKTEFRVWVGDFGAQNIVEIQEAKIQNGIYVKG